MENLGPGEHRAPFSMQANSKSPSQMPLNSQSAASGTSGQKTQAKGHPMHIGHEAPAVTVKQAKDGEDESDYEYDDEESEK